MFSQSFVSFILASVLISSAAAVTLTQLSQLTTTTYDYIIVGAGTAGLVVASRLTENPNITVLVLEAGVSDDGVLPVIAPFLGPTATPNTVYDWNYTVTAQSGMNGRSFAYPRGRILGGSSSVNYLIHQYGSSSDWDRYALVTGEASWAWSNMQKYVQKHEQFVPPVDGHNTAGQYIPSLHGFNGLVKTTLPAINMSMDHRVMMTTGQLSSEFPYNQDMSGGSKSLLGMGFAQSTTGGGVRSSSSTSYLAAANGRPNLTVLINATVMKLIQTGNLGLLKSFRSVQFGGSPGTASAGTTMTASARKEIILSAGSIGSVQILQLSGIGDASDLSALGITTLIDNPAVGENLSDHVFLPNIYSVNNTDTLDPILRGDPSVVGPAITQWTTDHTGVIANCVVNNMGFSRIPITNSVFLTTIDPASGPTSPHWELLPTNFFINPGTSTPATGNFMTMVTVLISPTSRGSIKIQSTNPFDKPIINPNFLTTNFDIVAMRESVKATNRFVAAPAWSDALIGPYGALAGATTDAQIDAYVRGIASTIFHPTGSLSMSSVLTLPPIPILGLPGSGALNPDLTVKGADGLRVVDASAFPFIPSSHTQGPTYLLAERAADFIKATW